MKTLVVKKRRKTPNPWKKKKRKPRYLEIEDLANYWNQEDQVLYCFKCNVETTDHEVDANPPNVEYKIWYAGNDAYEPRPDKLPPGTSTVERLDRTRRADGPHKISATVTKQPYIFCMTCHGPLCLAKKWNGKYYPEINFKGWRKNEREPIPIPVFEMPTSLEDAAEKIRLNHYLMVKSDHEHAFRAGCFFKWVCKKLDYGEWGQWIEENTRYCHKTVRNYILFAEKCLAATPPQILIYKPSVPKKRTHEVEVGAGSVMITDLEGDERNTPALDARIENPPVPEKKKIPVWSVQWVVEKIDNTWMDAIANRRTEERKQVLEGVKAIMRRELRYLSPHENAPDAYDGSFESWVGADEDTREPTIQSERQITLDEYNEFRMKHHPNSESWSPEETIERWRMELNN